MVVLSFSRVPIVELFIPRILDQSKVGYMTFSTEFPSFFFREQVWCEQKVFFFGRNLSFQSIGTCIILFDSLLFKTTKNKPTNSLNKQPQNGRQRKPSPRTYETELFL